MNDLGNKEIMAKNITRLMKARGMDRTQLASKIDVKYTTLTDWIKGNTYPRIDKIEKLANFFEVSKSELVEDQSEKPKNESANIVAAHIDDDTPEAERQQIINFIENLKKSRSQDK